MFFSAFFFRWGPEAFLPLGFFIGLGLGSAATASSVTTSPTPSPTPLLSVVPTEKKGLSSEEARQLRKEFIRAWDSELKAIKHRQEMEMKELKISQNARKWEWRKQDREKFKALSLVHKKREEVKIRRAFRKESEAKYRVFGQILRDEWNQRKQENQVRSRALKQESLEKLKEFETSLKQGEIPPDRLWPKI